MIIHRGVSWQHGRFLWPLCVCILLTVLSPVLVSDAAASTPELEIISEPAYGSSDPLIGRVTGTDSPSEFVVAVYIFVADAWYSKPGNRRLNPCPVVVDPVTGMWTAVVSGGSQTCDPFATRLAVFLVPTDGSAAPFGCLPELWVDGGSALPPVLDDVAIDHVLITREPAECATVRFADRSWSIKSSPDCPTSPGAGFFACDRVRVDAAGLHLALSRTDNKWLGAELISEESMGYGQYEFRCLAGADFIDTNAVLGIFLFDPSAHDPFRELDIIEISKWCDPANPANAQFVVQPYTVADNISRFSLDLDEVENAFTIRLDWEPGAAHFAMFQGHHDGTPPPNTLIHQWMRTGEAIPDHGDERIRLNFYFADCDGDGLASPSPGAQDMSFTVTDFRFEALDCERPDVRRFCNQPAFVTTNIPHYPVCDVFPEADAVTVAVNFEETTIVLDDDKAFRLDAVLDESDNIISVDVHVDGTVRSRFTKRVYCDPNLLTTNRILMYAVDGPDTFVIDRTHDLILGVLPDVVITGITNDARHAVAATGEVFDTATHQTVDSLRIQLDDPQATISGPLFDRSDQTIFYGDVRRSFVNNQTDPDVFPIAIDNRFGRISDDGSTFYQGKDGAFDLVDLDTNAVESIQFETSRIEFGGAMANGDGTVAIASSYDTAQGAVNMFDLAGDHLDPNSTNIAGTFADHMGQIVFMPERNVAILGGHGNHCTFVGGGGVFVIDLGNTTPSLRDTHVQFGASMLSVDRGTVYTASRIRQCDEGQPDGVYHRGIDVLELQTDNTLAYRGSYFLTRPIVRTAQQAASLTDRIKLAVPPVLVLEPDPAMFVAERQGDEDAVDYAVTLTRPPLDTVTIQVLPGPDLAITPATLTFEPANWDESQNVTVNAQDDLVVEGDHTGTITHMVTSTDPLFDGINTGEVVVTVRDDDCAEVAIISGGPASEDGGDSHFTVTLSRLADLDVTISYTVGGSAAMSVDYARLSGEVVIPAGQLTGTIPIDILSDTLVEGEETVVVTLIKSHVEHARIGANNDHVASLIITDQDIATVRFDTASATVDDVETTIYDAKLILDTNGSVLAQHVVVDIEIAGGTAELNSDFRLFDDVRLVFSPEQVADRPTAFPLRILADRLYEGSENVVLRITVVDGPASPGSETQRTHEVTILDIPPAIAKPVLELPEGASSVVEGTGHHRVPVRLVIKGGDVLASDLTVDVSDESDDAVAGADYQPFETTFVFPAGSRNGDIHVVDLTIISDTVVEGHEMVQLRFVPIAGPIPPNTGDAVTHHVTIMDDDIAPGIGHVLTAETDRLVVPADGETTVDITARLVFPTGVVPDGMLMFTLGSGAAGGVLDATEMAITADATVINTFTAGAIPGVVPITITAPGVAADPDNPDVDLSTTVFVQQGALDDFENGTEMNGRSFPIVRDNLHLAFSTEQIGSSAALRLDVPPGLERNAFFGWRKTYRIPVDLSPFSGVSYRVRSVSTGDVTLPPATTDDICEPNMNFLSAFIQLRVDNGSTWEQISRLPVSGTAFEHVMLPFDEEHFRRVDGTGIFDRSHVEEMVLLVSSNQTDALPEAVVFDYITLAEWEVAVTPETWLIPADGESAVVLSTVVTRGGVPVPDTPLRISVASSVMNGAGSIIDPIPDVATDNDGRVDVVYRVGHVPAIVEISVTATDGDAPATIVRLHQGVLEDFEHGRQLNGVLTDADLGNVDICVTNTVPGDAGDHALLVRDGRGVLTPQQSSVVFAGKTFATPLDAGRFNAISYQLSSLEDHTPDDPCSDATMIDNGSEEAVDDCAASETLSAFIQLVFLDGGVWEQIDTYPLNTRIQSVRVPLTTEGFRNTDETSDSSFDTTGIIGIRYMINRNGTRDDTGTYSAIFDNVVFEPFAIVPEPVADIVHAGSQTQLPVRVRLLEGAVPVPEGETVRFEIVSSGVSAGSFPNGQRWFETATVTNGEAVVDYTVGRVAGIVDIAVSAPELPAFSLADAMVDTAAAPLSTRVHIHQNVIDDFEHGLAFNGRFQTRGLDLQTEQAALCTRVCPELAVSGNGALRMQTDDAFLDGFVVFTEKRFDASLDAGRFDAISYWVRSLDDDPVPADPEQSYSAFIQLIMANDSIWQQVEQHVVETRFLQVVVPLNTSAFALTDSGACGAFDPTAIVGIRYFLSRNNAVDNMQHTVFFDDVKLIGTAAPQEPVVFTGVIDNFDDPEQYNIRHLNDVRLSNETESASGRFTDDDNTMRPSLTRINNDIVLSERPNIGRDFFLRLNWNNSDNASNEQGFDHDYWFSVLNEHGVDIAPNAFMQIRLRAGNDATGTIVPLLTTTNDIRLALPPIDPVTAAGGTFTTLNLDLSNLRRLNDFPITPVCASVATSEICPDLLRSIRSLTLMFCGDDSKGTLDIRQISLSTHRRPNQIQIAFPNGIPADYTSGDPLVVLLTLLDEFGDPIPDFGDVVTLSLEDGFVEPQTIGNFNTNGQAIAAINLIGSGFRALRVQDSGINVFAEHEVAIAPATQTIDSFEIEIPVAAMDGGLPDVFAGATFPIRITALDERGFPLPADQPITISVQSDTGTLVMLDDGAELVANDSMAPGGNLHLTENPATVFAYINDVDTFDVAVSLNIVSPSPAFAESTALFMLRDGASAEWELAFLERLQRESGMLEFIPGSARSQLYGNALAVIAFTSAADGDPDHRFTILAREILEAFDRDDRNVQIEHGVNAGGFQDVYDAVTGGSLGGDVKVTTGNNAWFLMAINYYTLATGDIRFREMSDALATFLAGRQKQVHPDGTQLPFDGLFSRAAIPGDIGGDCRKRFCTIDVAESLPCEVDRDVVFDPDRGLEFVYVTEHQAEAHSAFRYYAEMPWLDNNPSRRNDFRERAERVRNFLNNVIFSTEEGLFRDAIVTANTCPDDPTIHAAAPELAENSALDAQTSAYLSLLPIIDETEVLMQNVIDAAVDADGGFLTTQVYDDRLITGPKFRLHDVSCARSGREDQKQLIWIEGATQLDVSLRLQAARSGDANDIAKSALIAENIQRVQRSSGGYPTHLGVQFDECSNEPVGDDAVNIAATAWRALAEHESAVNPYQPPLIFVVPRSLDFGTIVVGQSSSPRSLSLHNIGQTPVRVMDIAILENDGEFAPVAMLPELPTTVAVGVPLAISLAYSPARTVASQARLVITTDHPARPVQVAEMTGLGVFNTGKVVAPATPFAAFPADLADTVSVDTTLSWMSGFSSCLVTFDVWFGEAEAPLIEIASDLVQPSIQLPILQTDTICAWQVIARSCGGVTAGPVWHFQTVASCNGQGAPEIQACASDGTIVIESGCETVLADLTAQLDVRDDCDPQPIITQSPPPGTALQPGTTVVVSFEAADAAGHAAGCSAAFAIIDSVAPVIVDCESTITVARAADCSQVMPDLGTFVVVSDNCTSQPVELSQSLAPGTVVVSGTDTVPVTVTATDISGNTDMCEFDVIFTDQSPPDISHCPEAVTLTADGTRTAAAPDLRSAAGVTDNCDTGVSRSQIPQPGTALPVGDNAVMLVFQDHDGNGSTCTVVVTVNEPETGTIHLAAGRPRDILVVPGATESIELMLDVTPGIDISSMQFRADLSPVGSSPDWTTLPQFSSDIGTPNFNDNTSFANLVLVAWLDELDPPLTGIGTVVGRLVITIPADAQPGDGYDIALSRITATDGVNAWQLAGDNLRLSVDRCRYQVGDVAPLVDGTECGGFGDGVLDILDVRAAFYWSLGEAVPVQEGNEAVPDVGADRFAAADTFPADQPPICGGNGILENADVRLLFERSLGPGGQVPEFEREPDTAGGCSSAFFGSSTVAGGVAAARGQKTGAGSIRADSAVIEIHGETIAGLPGDSVAVPIRIAMAKDAAVAFRLDVLPVVGATAVSGVRFVPGNALQNPDFNVANAIPGSVLLGWLRDVDTAVEPETEVGVVTFTIPENAAGGDSWSVQIAGISGAVRGVRVDVAISNGLVRVPPDAIDLRGVELNVMSDHMHGGRSDVAFTVVNAGTGDSSAFTVSIVHSNDGTIGNADDILLDTVVMPALAARTAHSETVSVALDVPTLFNRALNDDLPGSTSGAVSTSGDWIGMIIHGNGVGEFNEQNNRDQGKGIDKDDFTFFPWDLNPADGEVTPTDAIFVINRLGRSDTAADLDASGAVTPTDAISVINRLGRLINSDVIEEGDD